MSCTHFFKKENFNRQTKSLPCPSWRPHKKLKNSNTEESKKALESFNIEFSDQGPFRAQSLNL